MRKQKIDGVFYVVIFSLIMGVASIWLITAIERLTNNDWGATLAVKESGEEAINIILVIDERMLDVFNRGIF